MRRGAGVERPVGPHDDRHGPGGAGLYLLGVVAPHGLWADDPPVNGSVQVWEEEVRPLVPGLCVPPDLLLVDRSRPPTSS